MKIRNFFAAAITLLSLGMFVACNSDEEYDETFANNEKILKSEFAKSTIAPTKTIPAAIRAKMDSVELDIFSKLSTIGYVDYSFFDTEYYAENKQKILESLYQAYNKYVEEGKENIYFSICSPDKKQDNLRLASITPTEDGDHATFSLLIFSTPVTFGFEVELNILSNGYSERDGSLYLNYPDNYAIDSLSWSCGIAGTNCTISYGSRFLNTSNLKFYSFSDTLNYKLVFPPRQPSQNNL